MLVIDILLYCPIVAFSDFFFARGNVITRLAVRPLGTMVIFHVGVCATLANSKFTSVFATEPES